jgi:hypothetical protein
MCRPATSPRWTGRAMSGDLQAIALEVESNEIRLLRLMLRLEVKSGTAGGGTDRYHRKRSKACLIKIMAMRLPLRQSPCISNGPKVAEFR